MSTRPEVPKNACRATGFTATTCNQVVVWTDQGKEIPIVVPRYRIRALIAACLDALEDETNSY